MEPVDALVERFKPRGHVSSAELYLTIPDSYEFVGALRAIRCVVLGIEAVRMHGAEIHPLVDQIADFSGLLAETVPDPVGASHDAALAFLDQLPRDDAVRVTVLVHS